jgi:hypothetical protein
LDSKDVQLKLKALEANESLKGSFKHDPQLGNKLFPSPQEQAERRLQELSKDRFPPPGKEQRRKEVERKPGEETKEGMPLQVTTPSWVVVPAMGAGFHLGLVQDGRGGAFFFSVSARIGGEVSIGASDVLIPGLTKEEYLKNSSWDLSGNLTPTPFSAHVVGSNGKIGGGVGLGGGIGLSGGQTPSHGNILLLKWWD